MVANCVASGCKNEQDGTKPISFHIFPFKRPKILNLWIKAIDRENWYPSKTSKLCSEHFLPDDYQDRPEVRIKLLKWNAVPSVFPFSKSRSRNSPPLQIKEEKHSNRDVDAKIDTVPVPPVDTVPKSKLYVDRTTQTSTSSQATDHKTSLLRRKVKTLEQKLKRRDLKILALTEVIREISRNGHKVENLDVVLKKFFKC